MHKKLLLPHKICATCKKDFVWRKNGNQHGIKYFIVQNVVADKKRARKLIYFKSNDLLKRK